MAKIHQYANHAPNDPERIVVFNPTQHAIRVTSEGHRLRPREWAEVCPNDPTVAEAVNAVLTVKYAIPTQPSATTPPAEAAPPKPKRGRKPAATKSQPAETQPLNSDKAE